MKNDRRLLKNLPYYLIGVVETVIHEPGDEGGLPNCANSKKNGNQRRSCRLIALKQINKAADEGVNSAH